MADNEITMNIEQQDPSMAFQVTVNDTQRTPVDDTLSIRGMAADAKATGDAIALVDDAKVDKVVGKGLSTNDFTTPEKTKLAGIEAQANKTVIKNNLTTTEAGSALDATQGKALSESKVSKTDMPLTAALVNTNARTYQFSDSRGNAYPITLKRNYTNPPWIVVESGVSASGAIIAEVVGNVVIVSVALNIEAFTGTKKIMTFSKYIPARYVRSMLVSEAGDARAVSLGNGSGNLQMYGASAGRYRGEIVYVVDTIPEE